MVYLQGKDGDLFSFVLIPNFLKQGAELKRDEKIRFSFYRDIPFDYTPEDLKFETGLDASDAESPPKYPWEGEGMYNENISPAVQSHAFRVFNPFLLRAGVNRKCTLSFDLSSLPKSQLTERTSMGGTKYYSVDYDLVITVLPAMWTFSAECSGVQYGSIDVEY